MNDITEISLANPTSVIVLGAIGEHVLAADNRPVPVEVVRLEKPCPKLALRHLMWHVLSMFLPHYNT